ncbi:MAG: class IV adenylate cyclase [Halobacteriales archaeon]
MYEVEVKVRADLERVRRRLESLDADFRGTTEQVDTYFDHPARALAETDEALRIRRSDGDATLTYKGPKVDERSKTREELQTPIDDPWSATQLLEALGFEPVADVEKRRERFAIDGVTVTLDCVAGVGEFVEAERGGERVELDELRTEVKAVLERVGLDPAEQVRRSYLELLLNSRE